MSAVDIKPGSDTQIVDRDLEKLLEDTYYEDGDEERFSHYVLKNQIVESAVTGKALRALCGKKWVPSRNPESFPVCPKCKQIYEELLRD
ncbi:DUF3039 domain-containing protein [Canibacter sp. lx-45]|uniref:DUF3039 domain-containing protein n=1 Tax=Canibacter zhuwentaonis TaxID=2837491 RepID=UPI001BDC18E7|nr:DUF3039 domain-containing protein [Canibacter zhuwentaonis]MBT1034824.1 DUF3039 domain-containing protein [Canibacter zhuwentaonis]